jgi:hypothetical protein
MKTYPNAPEYIVSTATPDAEYAEYTELATTPAVEYLTSSVASTTIAIEYPVYTSPVATPETEYPAYTPSGVPHSNSNSSITYVYTLHPTTSQPAGSVPSVKSSAATYNEAVASSPSAPALETYTGSGAKVAVSAMAILLAVIAFVL